MTTIAYRAGQLAGDSCHSWCDAETDDYYCYKYANKLTLTDHVAFGTSGDADCPAFLEMLTRLRKPADWPDWKERSKHEGVRAIVVFRKGGEVFMLDDGELDDVPPGDYCAIGSGKRWAWGAMDGSKNTTAEDAVRAAAYRDLFTRPPIWSWSLGAQAIVKHPEPGDD